MITTGPAHEPGTGAYLAMTVCSECHELDLHGNTDWGMPDLGVVVLAYTPETFAHLMRTGEPADGRELNLMDDVAMYRFSSFTDEEIATLYAHLKELGPKPMEE